jgi:hypothetical protein
MSIARGTVGMLMCLVGLLILFPVVAIIISGEPAAFTGACRYCLNHYAILAAPAYLWGIFAANVILIGIGFYGLAGKNMRA